MTADEPKAETATPTPPSEPSGIEAFGTVTPAEPAPSKPPALPSKITYRFKGHAFQYEHVGIMTATCTQNADHEIWEIPAADLQCDHEDDSKRPRAGNEIKPQGDAEKEDCRMRTVEIVRMNKERTKYVLTCKVK